MIHAKSEFDIASSAPSSPLTPSSATKRSVYYVQSPSLESNDEDKSSRGSNPATATYNSPLESPSPSHPSPFSRHSRSSSESRVSGTYRKVRRAGGGWVWRGNSEHCEVIDEEDEYYGDIHWNEEVITKSCQVLIWVVVLMSLFGMFCLVIWGVSRPYHPQVFVKSLTVNSFYTGEGTDLTGVPTRVLTSNCSLKLKVYNPATFFGIHVSSPVVHLSYYDLTVAAGQMKAYDQPRKSWNTATVHLEGSMVPLYGAGAAFSAIENNENAAGVPLKLDFVIISRGHVIGMLVRSMHRRHVSCSLTINTRKTKTVKFADRSCVYV